jgi:hypothetical protein
MIAEDAHIRYSKQLIRTSPTNPPGPQETLDLRPQSSPKLSDSGMILDYDNHPGSSAPRGATIVSLPDIGVPAWNGFLPLHDAHFKISDADVAET